MAALSYYCSEPTMIDSQDYDQLQAFPDQTLFDPNDLFHTSSNPNPSSLLLDFSNDNNPVFDPCNFPKLQKVSDQGQTYSPDPFMINEPDFFDGIFQNPNCAPCLEDYYLQPRALFLSPALPDFPTGPPVYSSGSCEGLKVETVAGGRGPSAQSIAARQRRRKITEKTQELGKLVPGGQKMNTAEMLQAAYKYIKFLQAQVGILEFVSSHDHQENGESLESGEAMQVLLGSYLIQEKLYSSEKCLVPEKFAQKISEDGVIMTKLNPQTLV